MRGGEGRRRGNRNGARENDNEGEVGRLSLSVWEVYSDTVILDWLISLENKFRSALWLRQELIKCKCPIVCPVKSVL